MIPAEPDRRDRSDASRHYTLDIDTRRRFLRITWVRDVTAPALRRLWEELAKDPRELATFATLIDLRAVRVAITPDEIRALALGGKAAPPSNRAIVTSTDADFALMRMFEMLSEPGPRQFAVFRSIPDACTWLGNPACAPED